MPVTTVDAHVTATELMGHNPIQRATLTSHSSTSWRLFNGCAILVSSQRAQLTPELSVAEQVTNCGQSKRRSNSRIAVSYDL